MWPVVVLDTEWLKSLGPWLPAKRGRLVAEYVRLYAEMQVNFELPESIAP